VDELDERLWRLRDGRRGFLLGAEEEATRPVRVYGGLGERLRDDGGLLELDAEAEMDQGVQEPYQSRET
jgi:hypothetical protein